MCLICIKREQLWLLGGYVSNSDDYIHEYITEWRVKFIITNECWWLYFEIPSNSVQNGWSAYEECKVALAIVSS